MKKTEKSDIFIGTDIVEVSRIRSAIRDNGLRFLNKIYTKSEQKYCDSKANPSIHYSGRFAAKEAVIKAIKSTGFKNPISFTSIDIHSKASGKPQVVLEFKCNGFCRVSISHTNEHAIASAIFIYK